MLERLASGLVEATEALAGAQLLLKRSKREIDSVFYHLPVIVTNAKLYACSFDPDKVRWRTANCPQAPTLVRCR
jgi:hypothetical protein